MHVVRTGFIETLLGLHFTSKIVGFERESDDLTE